MVKAFYRSRLQLANQRRLRSKRFSHHHETAGVFIQTMYDACTRHVFKLRRMVQECILQGSAPVAAPWMDDQSSRLVDDDQRLVLMDNVQRNRFG